MPRFLHVGCGPKRKNRTVKAFAAPEWEEVSLDIDESVKPDIVDKLPDLSQREVGQLRCGVLGAQHRASLSA